MWFVVPPPVALVQPISWYQPLAKGSPTPLAMEFPIPPLLLNLFPKQHRFEFEMMAGWLAEGKERGEGK